MTKWYFSCIDNSGKRQCITVSASNKPEAINKGINKAKKNATGDITNWNCTIKSL